MDDIVIKTSKLNRAKTWCSKHKTKILIGTTALAGGVAALSIRQNLEHDDFLKEHELYDEYHTSNNEE